MNAERASRGWFNGRLIFGLFVLALGVIFTLDTLGYGEARYFLRFWPLLLVALGAIKLAEIGCPSCQVIGGLLVLFGGFLLLDTLGVYAFDWGVVFPLALVAIGGAIVWQALGRPGTRAAADEAASGTVNGFALLGAVARRSTSSAFHGGNATALLGACEIDLRSASLAEGGAVVDTFAFWGGVEIRVPADWQVEVRGTPILGAFEDLTRSETTAGERKLVVKGMAIMGGVEVKN